MLDSDIPVFEATLHKRLEIQAAKENCAVAGPRDTRSSTGPCFMPSCSRTRIGAELKYLPLYSREAKTTTSRPRPRAAITPK